MAFNKHRVLESAQRYLNQGKIPQAIAEYQQILRQDPHDQITLMTVGDLFVRSGKTAQALDYYEKLAQLYLAEGFNSKCIAIYKKIAKLAPEETPPLEKLAELYVQQGVMSEARSVYLQLAEAHLKGNRLRQAVDVLQKLLDLDPDNQRVQLRLAELYQAMGQKAEASMAFLGSAYRMFDRGEFPEARRMAERALSVDPKNTRAVMLKARAIAAGGEMREATALLESRSDVTAGIEGTRYLCELYLQTNQAFRAVPLAKQLLERAPDNYGPVFDIAHHFIEGGDATAGLRMLGEVREPMLAAGDFDRLTRALTSATERLPGTIEPLELLVDTCRRANDSVRLPEALDQLAETCAAAGQLDRAHPLFEELHKFRPEDEDTRRRLNQVRQKLGLEPVAAVAARAPAATQAPAAAAPPPFPEELQTAEAAAVPEAPLDEDTQRYVAQALTDVDLFSSYGLTQKAIDLLESVLQRVPRHVGALEKLLDLNLGAGNDRRTAELAGQLEQIHRGIGDRERTERFAELRRRYQRAAGVAPEEPAAAPGAPPEFRVPVAASDSIPVVSAEPVAEAAVHEVDLSAEWEALSQKASEEPPAPPPAAAEEIVLEEEVAAPGVPQAAAPAAPEPEVEPYDIELTPQAPAAKAPMSSQDFLAEIEAEVRELDLPTGEPAAAEVKPAAEPMGQLQEVFNEFRAELGEMGEEKEDPETHYNLGIAYREMGLLEEAIGEFQKVAKFVQEGASFRYAMQCCTLLGLSFMDQGQPVIAAMWYRKALQTPGLDQESVLALHYDLGVALEASGDRKSALESFNQVYALNIDYRDVAERIAALREAR